MAGREWSVKLGRFLHGRGSAKASLKGSWIFSAPAEKRPRGGCFRITDASRQFQPLRPVRTLGTSPQRGGIGRKVNRPYGCRLKGPSGRPVPAWVQQRLNLPPGGRWICFHCPKEGNESKDGRGTACTSDLRRTDTEVKTGDFRPHSSSAPECALGTSPQRGGKGCGSSALAAPR